MKGLIAACLASVLIILSLAPTQVSAANDFVSVNGTQFYLNGRPFYFAGTNTYYLWFGNWVCGSYDHNQGCSKEVLNDAKAMNLTVMRVWGFSDGYNYWARCRPTRASTAIQISRNSTG